MKALGNHVIAEFYDCDLQIIRSQSNIEDIMIEAVQISGAEIVKPVFHTFSPHGVSGMVIVAESHFSIHTWPEYGYCAVDIFTCGNTIDNGRALEYLRKELKAKSLSVVEMKRGIIDLEKDFPHKPESPA